VSTAEDMAREIVKGSLDDILNGNAKALVEASEQLGRALAKEGMEASQIRKIFSEVKAMTEYDEYRLNLLLPRLAYAAGRHKAVRPLETVVSAAIGRIDGPRRFRHFKDFFEAIVAYHRRWS